MCWAWETSGGFQSTLPVWGATNWLSWRTTSPGISIHAPRVGSDQVVQASIFCALLFQSTLPVWGATVKGFAPCTAYLNFNPRSPCGERRDRECAHGWHRTGFQSTLPVWGATNLVSVSYNIHIFQSTLPVWGATARYQAMATKAGIFQSTLPVWGATIQPYQYGHPVTKFQSTLPVWGATASDV